MSPDAPQNMQYRMIRFSLHSKANRNVLLVNISIVHSSPFSDATV